MLLLFVAIGAVEWLTMARIVRGQVLSLRKQEFIEACISLGLPTRRIIFYYAFYMMLFSAIPAAFFWTHPTRDEVWVLILIGFLGILGQSCITHGFTVGEATITVPFDYMRIVYSAIFGILLFAEIPSWWSVAGAALIVGSNLYLIKRT